MLLVNEDAAEPDLFDDVLCETCLKQVAAEILGRLKEAETTDLASRQGKAPNGR